MKHFDICSRCQRQYPEVGYITDMFTSTQGYLHVCGICALEITNETHGTKMKHFKGALAEEMRQNCLHWLRTHP